MCVITLLFLIGMPAAPPVSSVDHIRAASTQLVTLPMPPPPAPLARAFATIRASPVLRGLWYVSLLNMIQILRSNNNNNNNESTKLFIHAFVSSYSCIRLLSSRPLRWGGDTDRIPVSDRIPV
jgi:hypothetical protein